MTSKTVHFILMSKYIIMAHTNVQDNFMFLHNNLKLLFVFFLTQFCYCYSQNILYSSFQ